LQPIIQGLINVNFAFMRDTVFGRIPLMSYLLKNVSDSGILLFLFGIVLIAVILKNIFLYLGGLNVTWLTCRIANSLRKNVFQRYLSFGKQYFDQKNIGDIYSTLIMDINFVSREIVRLDKTLVSIFMIIVYMAIATALSWRVTVLMLVMIPMVNLLISRIVEKIKKSSETLARNHALLCGNISNSLMAIPLIKAYSYEVKERGVFNRQSDMVEQASVSMGKKSQLIPCLQDIFTMSVMILAFAVIAFMLFGKKIGHASDYVIMIFVFNRARGQFGFWGSIRAAMAVVRGPLKRIMRVFNDRNKFFVIEGQKTFEGLKRSIEIRGLKFSYNPGVEVLKGVNIEIEKNKVTAIVGATGSGKTTLISLLMKYYNVPAGSIWFDGTDINEFKIDSLRRAIALVSQEVFLFNDTIRYNICYGLDRPVPDSEIADILRQSRLHDFVASLPQGLNTAVGDRGIKLSGGEKQRIAIARALLKQSEILMLDEATSSLDSVTERLVQEAINTIMLNRTSIVIAHRLSTIKHADKIIVLEYGVIAEEGTLESLLARKGKFYEYWENQKFS
ncbi:MAG: ABC transporter ATP-binding protein, partial [Candidatus Omnitrophota bacterium]